MASEPVLKQGSAAVYRDPDATVLVLVCEHHQAEQALPLHWPNFSDLLHDFLDRHCDCALAEEEQVKWGGYGDDARAGSR
jgi:hypothetical protein